MPTWRDRCFHGLFGGSASLRTPDGGQKYMDVRCHADPAEPFFAALQATQPAQSPQITAKAARKPPKTGRTDRPTGAKRRRAPLLCMFRDHRAALVRSTRSCSPAPVACCLFPVTRHPSPVSRCPVPSAQCPVPVALRSLPVARCPLPVTRRPVCARFVADGCSRFAVALLRPRHSRPYSVISHHCSLP